MQSLPSVLRSTCSALRYARCTFSSAGRRSFADFSRATLARRARTPVRASVEQHAASASSVPGAVPVTPAGVYSRWKSQWGLLLEHLHQGGHFAADPQVHPGQLAADKGACKRAVLSFARQRQDLRYKLPQNELRELVLAGFPSPDRKSVNAYKRLEATFLRGVDLPPGDGGPADFQDIMRMLYALAVVAPATAELESPGLAAAACKLMPDIIKAAQEPLPAPTQGTVSTRGMPRPVFHSQRKIPRERGQQGDGAGRRRSPAGALGEQRGDGSGRRRSPAGTPGERGRRDAGSSVRRQFSADSRTGEEQEHSLLPWWKASE